MRRRQNESEKFHQLQNIIHAEIRDICEIAPVKKILRPSFHSTKTKNCGFDLQDVKIFLQANRRLKISFPQSRILNSYADMHSVKIYHKETSIFAKDITLEEQSRLVAADLEERKQKSTRAGLLLRANENARRLLLSRIEHRVLNRNFGIQITTSGNVLYERETDLAPIDGEIFSLHVPQNFFRRLYATIRLDEIR